jgi:uncharacterized protein DUF5667
VTPETQRLEALAERLRAVEPVMPSPAAKIRGWNLVAASVEHAAKPTTSGRSVWRLGLAGAAAAVLLVAGAVAASANSLPDSPFYGIKGALEQVRGDLAISPADRLAYHLDLAQTRLTEAEAMITRHRLDLTDQALGAMNQQLQDAADVVAAEDLSSPALATDMQARLEQAIEVHDQQLAGLQGEVTNPTAQLAIARARDGAAQLLQAIANDQTNANAAGQPQGQGSGKGSPAPHPTPKK